MLDDVQTLFFLILNMSLTASAVIAAVLLARLALRRAPKIFSYALWAVVLFRLLCPVSIPLPVSLMGALDAPAQAVTGGMGSAVTYVLPEGEPAPDIPAQSGEEGTVPDGGQQTAGQGPAQEQNGGQPQAENQQPAAARGVSPEEVAACVWLAGALATAGYAAASWLRLRHRLAEAAHLSGKLYLSDRIGTPFVLGLIRPRIYLPATLREELPYILAHERHHIRRGDHIWRLLAFLALALHWFNPLVWAAFLLSGKDMEMSCDEAVVKRLGEGIRADYSASLLSLATGRRGLPGMPLAFGEGETSGRIRNLLRWRRPKVWISVAAAAACLAVGAACVANPAGAASQEPGGEAPSGQYTDVEDYVNQVLPLIRSVSYENPRGGTSTVPVEEARLTSLTRAAQVDGLAPEGTLETWQFSYQVRLEGEGLRTVEGDGVTGQDGWYTLGSQPEMAILLRYGDGSCDVLREHSSLQGWGIWYENEALALHDWYVTERGLDEPRYVEEWIDRLPQLRQAGYDSFPARRFEGEGWSLLIPCGDPFWWDLQGDGSQQYWQWNSPLSGATLGVSWMETPLEWERENLRNLGYVAVDGAGLVWEFQEAYPDGYSTAHRVYFHLAQDGIWRLDLRWEPSQADGIPEAAADPAVLQAMAESFVMAEG